MPLCCFAFIIRVCVMFYLCLHHCKSVFVTFLNVNQINKERSHEQFNISMLWSITNPYSICMVLSVRAKCIWVSGCACAIRWTFDLNIFAESHRTKPYFCTWNGVCMCAVLCVWKTFFVVEVLVRFRNSIKVMLCNHCWEFSRSTCNYRCA